MKLAQLTETVAAVTGKPFGLVRLKHRLLREAGWLSSGGRGLGGAEMTAQDISVAVHAALCFGDTTEIVADIREMDRAMFDRATWFDADAPTAERLPGQASQMTAGVPPALASMPAPCNSIAALARLLECGAQIEWVKTIADEQGLSVEIRHTERLLRAEVAKLFVAQSGDRSDAMRFGHHKSREQSGWMFQSTFTAGGTRASRMEETKTLSGGLLRAISDKGLTTI